MEAMQAMRTARPVRPVQTVRCGHRRRSTSVLVVACLAMTPAIIADSTPASAATCQVSRPLRWGSKGVDVSCLEQTLAGLGYQLTTPDQFYGAATSDAVRSYQSNHSLPASSIAGVDTLASLGILASTVLASPPDHSRDDTTIRSDVIGTSVQGRAIEAIERGTPGGRVVLAVGDIHGDEGAGEAVIGWLRTMPVPAGIDLWLVPTMNPDGEALGQRQNAHGVDLNRNFPRKWGPLGTPGYWQYAGPSAASEPETKAMVALLDRIKPDVTLWYHQDLNQVDPAGDPAVYEAYARFTAMRVENVTGGTYTGTATQYCYGVSPDGTAFVVELPPRVPGLMALRHASALFAAVKA